MDFRIGLVTDGEVDDQSFNQSTWEGVQQAAQELGGTADYIETQSYKDYADNIAKFARQGYDVIVTVGYAMVEATLAAAAEYPDVMFIGVDQYQAEPVDNVAGLIFHEDEEGFLAGALAAYMSESSKVAGVYGTDLVPAVVSFREGYEAGALYVNPDIEVISTYHPGGLDVAFTDPEWGATTAAQAIDRGADVIFGAAGWTGNGALIEAAYHEGVYCIGVDADQWEIVPEAHPCLISSAMKLIVPGVVELTTMAYNDEFPAGNYFGDVGLAPFHDFEDAIPDDVKAALEEIDAGLRDGSIETTITETVTEEEFNEGLDAEGFVADFQPDKIVLTGDVEGMEVVMEMTFEVVGGELTGQITSVTLDGEPMDPALFADINEDLSKEIFDDPDYAVDSIVITEDDMTITASRR